MQRYIILLDSINNTIINIIKQENTNDKRRKIDVIVLQLI